MDPNEVLKNILANARKVRRTGECCANDDFYQIEAQLANDILDLHDWLIAGGFLPDRWISRK